MVACSSCLYLDLDLLHTSTLFLHHLCNTTVYAYNCFPVCTGPTLPSPQCRCLVAGNSGFPGRWIGRRGPKKWTARYPDLTQNIVYQNCPDDSKIWRLEKEEI